MAFKFLAIVLIALQFVYSLNAFTFFDLKGKNLDFVFEPFSKYENKCVFLSEFNFQLIGLSNEAQILNYFHEKYSRYGLKVIGYYRKNKSFKKPSNMKFEIFIGNHSIKRLNDFLRTRDLELIRDEKFLIHKNGRTVDYFKLNPKYKLPKGILQDVLRKIPTYSKKRDDKIFEELEKRVNECLGLEYD